MKLFGTLDEETRLLRGCQKGNTRDQAALYERYKRKMFAVCLRYASDRDTAEDLLQEGFIKVFRHIGNFQEKGSLEGWIRRIMVNTALEYCRREVKFFPVVDLEKARRTSTQEDISSDLHAEALLQLVQDLPTGYRTIFNLYAIEGFSHKEIAEQLGISEGTSKSQLARAREVLQEKVRSLEVSYGKASDR